MNTIVHDTIVKIVAQPADTTLPLLSAVTAILAVIIGPSIQWYIAKRQINSASSVASQQIDAASKVATQQIEASLTQGQKSISSAERQTISQQNLTLAKEWITDIRRLSAEFIAACTVIATHIAGAKTTDDRTIVAPIILAQSFQATQFRFQIAVLLTSRPEHQKYFELFGSALYCRTFG